jgi:hypothetical protein
MLKSAIWLGTNVPGGGTWDICLSVGGSEKKSSSIIAHLAVKQQSRFRIRFLRSQRQNLSISWWGVTRGWYSIVGWPLSGDWGTKNKC